jgi:hypothetical protein
MVYAIYNRVGWDTHIATLNADAYSLLLEALDALAPRDDARTLSALLQSDTHNQATDCTNCAYMKAKCIFDDKLLHTVDHVCENWVHGPGV